MSDIDKHAVKKRFDDAAKGAEALYKELSLLSSRVELEVDRRACRSMITDLGPESWISTRRSSIDNLRKRFGPKEFFSFWSDDCELRSFSNRSLKGYVILKDGVQMAKMITERRTIRNVGDEL